MGDCILHSDGLGVVGVDFVVHLRVGEISRASVGIVLLMTVWVNRVSLFRMFWGNRGFLFKTFMVVVTGLVFYLDVLIIFWEPCFSAKYYGKSSLCHDQRVMIM